jgi:hypothetical protein
LESSNHLTGSPNLTGQTGDCVPWSWCNSWPVILETGVGHQYVLQRWLVFRVSGRWWRDLARFWSVHLVALAINLVALPLLVEIVHLSVLPAQTIVMLGVALGTFVAHRSLLPPPLWHYRHEVQPLTTVSLSEGRTVMPNLRTGGRAAGHSLRAYSALALVVTRPVPPLS